MLVRIVAKPRIPPAALLMRFSAMIDSPIVFLDSGIGGLPYLQWLKQRYSGPLIYVADTAFFPYGELSEPRIKEVVTDTSKRIFSSLSPKLLVIACNTASVSALEEVRSIAPCPVVGTVPAVKPAAASAGSAPIGVLATDGTVNSPYLDNLVESFASDRSVVRQAAGDIVRYVEDEWLDSGEKGAIDVMRPALENLKLAGVGSIVLGCTHFLHVTAVISAAMSPDVKLIDSRDGVGRRILHLLESSDKPTSIPTSEQGLFYVTVSGLRDDRYRQFAGNYGLSWGGTLK